MIIDFNKGACATEVNIGPAPTCWNHYVFDICTIGKLKNLC
jgi:hypothetical protein